MSGKISYQLGLDAMPLRRAFAGAMDSVRSFSSGLMKLTGIAGGLGALGGALGAGFGVIKSVNLAADLEDTAMSFEVMLKSGARAAEMLKDIQKYADPTSFHFAELADAAGTLLNKGAEAGGIMDTIRMLGDVSAGSRKNIGELAEAYGRVMQSKRLSGEELQLFEKTPLMSELMKQLGVGSAGIRKMAEEGKLDFNNLQKAFRALTGEGGAFYKMVEKMGTTFNAKVSTMGDTFNALLREFGKPINVALKPLIEKGSDFLASMQEGGRILGETAADGIRVAVELFRSGELGGVLVAGLKLGAIEGANLLISALSLAAGGLAAMLRDTSTWAGIGDAIGSACEAGGKLISDCLAKAWRELVPGADQTGPLRRPSTALRMGYDPSTHIALAEKKRAELAKAGNDWLAPLKLGAAELETFLRDAFGKALKRSRPDDAMMPGLGWIPGGGMARRAMKKIREMQEEMAYQTNEGRKKAFAAMGGGNDSEEKGGRKSHIRAASSLAAVGGWLGGAGSTESRVQKSQLDTQKEILKVSSETAKNTARFRGGVFTR